MWTWFDRTKTRIKPPLLSNNCYAHNINENSAHTFIHYKKKQERKTNAMFISKCFLSFFVYFFFSVFLCCCCCRCRCLLNERLVVVWLISFLLCSREEEKEKVYIFRLVFITNLFTYSYYFFSFFCLIWLMFCYRISYSCMAIAPSSAYFILLDRASVGSRLTHNSLTVCSKHSQPQQATQMHRKNKQSTLRNVILINITV